MGVSLGNRWLFFGGVQLSGTRVCYSFAHASWSCGLGSVKAGEVAPAGEITNAVAPDKILAQGTKVGVSTKFEPVVVQGDALQGK